MIRGGAILTPGMLSSLTLPGGWGPASITSATPRGFVDFEDNTKITNTDGAVETIVDSISASSFTQGTAANRPLLITSADSGRQVASFNGTAQELTIASIPTNWPTGGNAGGIFVACNQLATSGTLFAVSYGGLSTNNNRSIIKATSGGLGAARGNAGATTETVPSLNTSVNFFGRHSVFFEIGATTIRCDVDGAAGPTVTTTPNTGTTRARIGSNSGTSPASFWLGEISAIVVWAGTLDATETGYLYLWGSSRLGYRP